MILLMMVYEEISYSIFNNTHEETSNVGIPVHLYEEIRNMDFVANLDHMDCTKVWVPSSIVTLCSFLFVVSWNKSCNNILYFPSIIILDFNECLVIPLSSSF